MSTHIVALRKPEGDKYVKMKAAYEACEAAGIPIPIQVMEFFRGRTPAEALMVDLDDGPGVREYITESHQGWEVDLKSLPPGIDTIRFFNSW
jgi:hypothetical protein